jgi:hypothetical protein
MVKGISRRVIVVRAPDPRFFDQAIFLMKEDALHQEGVTAEQVVEEARRVAAGYVQRNAVHTGGDSWWQRLPKWAWALAGAGFVAALWLLTAVLF